ncbi:MAG TPA: flagellar biosynthesis protein FliA [Ruminococcaceae bacterium]|nr:flagellar biosynthesis protein FliA [Oscillospiraceae bacterium]
MPAPNNNRALFLRAEKGDASAQTQIIENNLGLVHAAARHFSGKGLEYDDLFQAGCMGLVKAVTGFDLGRGVRFSTYAVPVIMGEMRRLFRDDGPIKISRSLKELSLKATRAREILNKRLCREPTLNELASEMQIDPTEAAQALEAAAAPLSLTKTRDDAGNEQADIPVDSDEDQLIDRLALKDAILTLPKEFRELIILRYFQGKTQTETARVLGMTQVQVSRKEKKILSILRNHLAE